MPCRNSSVFFLTMFHWKPQGIFPTLQQSSLAGLPANDAPRLLSECDLARGIKAKCWFSGPWMILQVAEVTQIHQILGLFLANCQLAMLGISVVVSQKCSRLANQIVVHIRILLHHKPKQNIKQNLELKTTLPYFNQRVTFQVFLSPKITSWEFTNISRLKWPKSSTTCQLQRLQTWIW